MSEHHSGRWRLVRSSPTTTRWILICICVFVTELHLKRLIVGGLERIRDRPYFSATRVMDTSS